MTNQFATLALTALVSSPTNPRKTFNQDKLQELANSITSSGGVHQPILVRQLPAQRLLDTAHLKPRPEYEIVAGERRYRASIMAKMDTIPALIRELTDDQVLEIQIIENLQRDGLTDLEAAEGYQALMDHNKLTPEQVGAKIGKSRTFVYNCLKLLALSPDAKQAMRTQGLSTSAAQLIARIPNDALQAKALAYATDPDDDGDLPSYRDFSHWLQRNVMLNLAHACFPIDQADFVPGVSSCTNCSKRTGANPDLFTDVKSADMCTNPPCYHAKDAKQDELDETDDVDGSADAGREIGFKENSTEGSREMARLAQAAARQAASNPEDSYKKNIQRLKDDQATAIDAASRIAQFEYLVDHIHSEQADVPDTLLSAELLRAWLLRRYDDYNAEEIAFAFKIDGYQEFDSYHEQSNADDAYMETVKLRIQRAPADDIYRYMTALMLLDDRERYAFSAESIQPATLFDAFAQETGIDLSQVKKEAAEDIEADFKAQIADLNKKIKALKADAKTAKVAETTSAHGLAGAASDLPVADAKKSSASRKPKAAKTSTEEAKAGIAAAMQSVEAEPLGAALGGSGASTFKVGEYVEVLDGKHKGKLGLVASDDGADLWTVTLKNSTGLPFAKQLPTKSLKRSQQP